MLSKIAWTSLASIVLLVAGLAIGVTAYLIESVPLGLLSITTALGAVSLSVLSYREV
jgi:hypothetical protein